MMSESQNGGDCTKGHSGKWNRHVRMISDQMLWNWNELSRLRLLEQVNEKKERKKGWMYSVCDGELSSSNFCLPVDET